MKKSSFYVWLCLLTFSLAACSPSMTFQAQPFGASSLEQAFTAELTVGTAGTNPPLDLFFVVDDSASMLGHQINLGSAFSTIFQSNSTTLSNFNTNIYVFSTASTYNQSYLSVVPSRSPASITSVPAPSDFANVSTMPGSIFAFWNNASGSFGTAPFSEQFNPASVLNYDADVKNITPSIYIPAKGSQTDAAYQASIASLTAKFQARLAYLNPTTQLSYEPLTDVSSGLCSMARILKHSSSFIQPGDSAAFIVVSDDNDRLNDRNPNNNQCVESISGSNQVVDGTCGHYQTYFTYNSSSNITYQSDTKFPYQTGTQVSYTYPTSDSCTIQYNGGYNYSWTYTAVKTAVSYTMCTQMGDGTCLNTAPTTQTISGNYVGSGSNCSQSMASLVNSPAIGTSYSCASANVANQSGPSGVDTASNGSTCSTGVISSLQAQSNVTNVACTIGSVAIDTTTVPPQSVGSCSSYCSNHTSQYPGCNLVSATTNTTSGSFQLATNGLQCSSTCTDSSKCGTGTIASYITNNYGSAATCGTVATTSSVVVNAGANTDGTALGCGSSLSGLQVHNAGGTLVCSGASTVQACLASLQSGTPSTCGANGGDTATVSAPINVGCSTACANSGGFCSSSGTVAQALAAKNEYCMSASNGGSNNFTLQFSNGVSQNANCSSKCSDAISGSCDGHGFGATNGATVSDYINQQLSGGSTCNSTVQNISDTASIAAPANNTASVCTTSASPFFFATDGAHPGATVTSYVAGDANHLAADFQNYIVNQARSVFGANSPTAVAVITQLPGDNLQGTDIGQDYIDLATKMNSTQVTSITADYSVALAQISSFIATTTQNNFSLSIPSTDVVFAVSVMKQGTTNWVPMSSSLWTWAGHTLSVNPSAGLKTGDQILYQYHN